MARAETIESVGETGGGGGGGGAGGANGPLSRHNTCRMELPRPFHTWHSVLTTPTVTAGSGTGTHLHHHNHHHLHPFYLSYLLPDGTQTHQQLPASSPSSSSSPPPSPLCDRREGGAVTPSAFSGEESESDREERQEASSRRGPLPDLLPQNEHPSWASARHRAPRGEAAQELEVRRVAGQLRAIGDEFNATALGRAHAALHWQDWRDACRGLFDFIAQTLSTLYRLT